MREPSDIERGVAEAFSKTIPELELHEILEAISYGIENAVTAAIRSMPDEGEGSFHHAIRKGIFDANRVARNT